MHIVYEALLKRKKENRPIKVALVGAGAMGRAVALQMSMSVPGMVVAVIANRTLKPSIRAYAEAGVENPKEVKQLKDLEACIRQGIPAVTDNVLMVCQAEGIDAVMEITGSIEFGANVSMEAIKNNKHLVLMNAELDGTIGPILKVHADKAGVVITNIEGDQPGVIMNLYHYVKAMGLKPVLCGNIKGLQDHYRTPTTQMGWAKKWKQDIFKVTSFADGTKISFEQSIVANATDMHVVQRGMMGPEVPPGTPIMDAVKLFSIDKVLGGDEKGIVDFIVGPDPNSGVFVLATMDHPEHRRYLNLYKVGEGPLYCFYTPHHLCYMEAPYSVARAVLFNESTIAPEYGPKVEVVATGKKELKKGEKLDMIGGYATYGQCENRETSRKGNLLPMGIAEDCVLKRNISKDEVITYDDVELPEDRLVDRLRIEQDSFFS